MSYQKNFLEYINEKNDYKFINILFPSHIKQLYLIKNKDDNVIIIKVFKTQNKSI